MLATNPHPVSASPDGPLGACGKVITDIMGVTEEAYSMAVQADGKILLAGRGFAVGVLSDFALARYNTDGTLDTTFGTDGKVTTDIGGTTQTAYSMAVQTDGKILLAGITDVSPHNFAVVRYDTNGSLDTTFGTDGKVTTVIGGSSINVLSSMAIQPDGKILLAGYTGSSVYNDFVVVRYNTNGSPDTTFGTGGKVTTDFGVDSQDQAYSMAVQADGKILVAGLVNAVGIYDFAVVRYDTNGSPDTTFGTGGKVTTDIAGSFDSATALAIQPDGKILVAGYGGWPSVYFAVVRYNTNGSLDTTFDTDGKVITDFGGSAYARALVIQPDGKILVAGSDTGPSADFLVVRYNTNGSLDTTFDTDGKVITDIDDMFTVARALVIQPNGKILVAGSVGHDFALVRYNTNGSLDRGVACTEPEPEPEPEPSLDLDLDIDLSHYEQIAEVALPDTR